MSTMNIMTNSPHSAFHIPQLNIPLTAHHLRFTCTATAPLAFNDFKGSALRGALASVLRRTFCAEWRAEKTAPLHQALCPICQLLSVAGDEETASDVRRPYAIEPVFDEQTHFATGETFRFGLALYGDKLAYLPYLVLAVKGMGETGLGQKGANSQRGRFTIERIDAVNPLSEQAETMLAAGERMVRLPNLPVTHAQVMQTCAAWLPLLAAQGNRLTVHFCTPTRLTQDAGTQKQATFFPFCKKVVLRVLDLCAQYGEGRPTVAGQPLELRRHIYPHADSVQLLADETQWWDLKGYSSRLDRAQVLGGFVGRATYYAPDWQPLLPWLLWGRSTHVGKNIVKGCGIYELRF